MTTTDDTAAALAWAGRALGHRFGDPALCRTALTHRSAASAHNERLEFLGDAIVNAAVARMLYDAQPKADEGALSRLRASLVNGEHLAAIAAEIGVGDHVRLGAGEMKTGGFRRASILADALEALVGAIYLDAGFDAAAAAVGRLIGPRMGTLPAAAALKDAKTQLQELLQSRGLPLPRYTLVSVSGEPHEQSFTVTCAVAHFDVDAVGQGASRRRAEQAAASRVLERLAAHAGSRA